MFVAYQIFLLLLYMYYSFNPKQPWDYYHYPNSQNEETRF